MKFFFEKFWILNLLNNLNLWDNFQKQQTLLELGSLQNERTRHLEEIESLRKYKLGRLQQNAETDKWREENDRLIEQVEQFTIF